jgi:hypothetical protein
LLAYPCGGARDNMEVYVIEIYDGQEVDKATLNKELGD